MKFPMKSSTSSDAMLARLEAETGYIKVTFPFFMEKLAPVQKSEELWTMKLPTK